MEIIFGIVFQKKIWTYLKWFTELNGNNANEVSLVSKNVKKSVFLRNFFNYLVSIVFSGIVVF